MKKFSIFAILMLFFGIVSQTEASALEAEGPAQTLQSDQQDTTLQPGPDRELETLFRDGMKYFDNEDYAIAEKIFEKLISLNSHNEQAYEQLGYIYGTRKEFQKAEQSFEKALTFNPHNVKVSLAMVEIYRMAGQFQKAEALLIQTESACDQKGDLKALRIIAEIRRDLRNAQYLALKAQVPELDNLKAVLAALNYEQGLAQELAIRLLPFYEKTPYMRPADANEMKKNLETTLQFLQSDMITQDYYGQKINQEHIEIYALLLNNEAHGKFFKEFCQNFESLNEDDQKLLLRAFQCSYQSYLGWILLTAKGFKVVPVATFVEVSNFEQVVNGKSKGWSLPNFFSKKENNADLFKREAHASLIVDVSNGQYVYMDLNNLYVSEPFSSDDYYCDTSRSSCGVLTNQRNDIFSRVSMLDKSQLRAVMYGYVSNFYQIKGQDQQALVCLDEALQFAPDFSDTYKEFAEYYLKKNQLNKAFEYFEKAVQADPYNDVFKYIYGVALLQNQKYDEAISNLEQAILHYSEEASYFYALGIAFINKERFQEAVESFQTVVNLDEHFPDGYNSLGISNYEYGIYLLNNKNFSEAKNRFKRALDIFKKYGDQEQIDETKKILNQYF